MQTRNSHRYLALRRGWIEEELSIQMGAGKVDESFDDDLTNRFQKEIAVGSYSGTDEKLKEVIEKAARVSL